MEDLTLTYYRGTNNPHEPNLIASGMIQQSFNSVSWKKEKGLSVVSNPAHVYDRFVIVYKVAGTPLKEVGSDGETLLDINTVRLPLY